MNLSPAKWTPAYLRGRRAWLWPLVAAVHCALVQHRLPFTRIYPLLLALAILPAHAVGPNNTLNDTGITEYGDASDNNLTTEPADYPGQDARYGRDAKAAAGQLSKTGGGSAGFDFTALNNSGNPTTPSSGANPHPCVRDNVTGLIWEVKTNDGVLRDQDWTYSWYDSNPDTNGGYAGYASYASYICRTAGRCDTEKYVADVNAAGLCGYSDWRLPTLKELQSIVDYGGVNPSINPTYFPNTPASYFWSASAYAKYSDRAWFVYFSFSGKADDDSKLSKLHVRLVRGGQ